MAIQRKSRAFKDISLSFSPHPVTKDLPVLTNERAIARSVRNLVETIPSERFFNSLLGTDVRGSLFDLFTTETDILNAGANSLFYTTSPTYLGYDCFFNETNCGN